MLVIGKRCRSCAPFGTVPKSCPAGTLPAASRNILDAHGAAGGWSGSGCGGTCAGASRSKDVRTAVPIHRLHANRPSDYTSLPPTGEGQDAEYVLRPRRGVFGAERASRAPLRRLRVAANRTTLLCFCPHLLH